MSTTEQLERLRAGTWTLEDQLDMEKFRAQMFNEMAGTSLATLGELVDAWRAVNMRLATMTAAKDKAVEALKVLHREFVDIDYRLSQEFGDCGEDALEYHKENPCAACDALKELTGTGVK